MDAYETALDCPVRFEREGYGVSIASDLLDAAPRFADAGLNTANEIRLAHHLDISPRAVQM
jgi:hypothetical protein